MQKTVKAKVIDYSKKAGKETWCLAIYWPDANALPYKLNLPPKGYVPIIVTESRDQYDAKLYARTRVNYVWISTSLSKNGFSMRLSDVLRPLGINKNDSVDLLVQGNHVRLL